MELLLAEVLGEQLTVALEDAQVNDVVVIDILHIQPVFIQRMTRNLVFRRIDGDIEVVALVVPEDDGIALRKYNKSSK